MGSDQGAGSGEQERRREEEEGRKGEQAGVFLFDIPVRYTPESRDVPTAEEVAAWVEAIIRLWDDADVLRAVQPCRPRACARLGIPTA